MAATHDSDTSSMSIDKCGFEVPLDTTPNTQSSGSLQESDGCTENSVANAQGPPNQTGSDERAPIVESPDLEMGNSNRNLTQKRSLFKSNQIQIMCYVAIALIISLVAGGGLWYKRQPHAEANSTLSVSESGSESEEELAAAEILSPIECVLVWQSVYHKMSKELELATKYSVRAIQITKSVFKALDENWVNIAKQDTGFGVFPKRFEFTQLDTVEKLEQAMQSGFEWVRIYAYYLPINNFPDELTDFTWLKFFNYNLPETLDKSAPIGFIFQRLFGCHNEGFDERKGIDVIHAVFESDLYHFLVNFFAKAADIQDNCLVITADSLSATYGAWFHNASQPIFEGDFLRFTGQFLDQMRIALMYCNDTIFTKLQQQPNLKTILHLSLIYIFYDFEDEKGQVDVINRKMNTNRYSSCDGTLLFSEFVVDLDESGVPVMPDKKTPLLPDLAD